VIPGSVDLLNLILLLLLFFFLLYNIVLVLPYINMHPPQVYTCFPSWNPLPPPSPYHPSGSSQCISPKLPVSCIEPGLAIHFLYDIIHVLMPYSQIIPPSLSHRVQKTVLYICVSFAVLHTDGIGREVGGGFRMGNMCTPVADACWCMAKPIQYCKVKKKIINK